MAEFVELRLEEMLPELEEMQRVQLFTEEEIKAVIKRRREFEYKMQKRSKQKEDYLKYIQYEINLLSLVKIRREKIGYGFKKPEIDYAIANRIHKLFMYAIFRFPNDINLWLSHIEFCKRMKWNSSISKIFVRLLAIKSSDPSLWILAAKWEFEENHSISNARSLMLRALRFHPNEIRIYTESFRLELMEADRLRKRREVLGLSCEKDLPDDEKKKDEILDGKLAILFYNDAKQRLKSAEDIVPFITVAKQFDFTHSIQTTLFKEMQNLYDQDEITWDTIARDVLDKSSVISEDPALKMKERIQLCMKTYENALDRLNTSRMWELYVETLFELYNNEILRSKVKYKLIDVCQRALTEGHLSQKHLCHWLDLVETSWGKSEKLKNALERSVELYPRNADLWKKYLDIVSKGDVEDALFVLDTGDSTVNSTAEEKMVEDIPDKFWAAVNSVGDSTDAIGLWEAAIEYYMKFRQNNPTFTCKIEGLFRKLLTKNPPISNHFKPRMLTWIADSQSLEEARQFYKEQENPIPDQSSCNRNL